MCVSTQQKIWETNHFPHSGYLHFYADVIDKLAFAKFIIKAIK